MLGKTEGRRIRGWQRMRWLVGITDSMDMSFSKLGEMVKDRKAWHAAAYLVTKSRTWLSNWTTTTETSCRAKNLSYRYTCKSSPSCVTRMFTATLFVMGGKIGVRGQHKCLSAQDSVNYNSPYSVNTPSVFLHLGPPFMTYYTLWPSGLKWEKQNRQQVLPLLPMQGAGDGSLVRELYPRRCN